MGNAFSTTQSSRVDPELWWKSMSRSLGKGNIIEGGQWTGTGFLVGLRGDRTTKSFMVVVEDGTADTSLPIIQQFIRPGTLIISDEWRAYCRIPSFGYTPNGQSLPERHQSCHRCPCQQCGGVYWSWVKSQMRRQDVMDTSSNLFPSYV